MKKLFLPVLAMFLFTSISSASSFVEELVYETCFDKADKVFNETEGTHSQKFDAFIEVYDECMAE